MQSYRPVIPNSDPQRFNVPIKKQSSPHYRPPQPGISQFTQPVDIKPQKNLTSNFIKSKDEQQKLNQTSITSSNHTFLPNSEQSFSNNYTGIQQQSFTPVLDEKKYSIGNPQQDTYRTSTGLPYQDSSELKGLDRKSESIVGIRQKITKQAGSNKQYISYRPLVDYATAQQGRKRSPSPYSLHFNQRQKAKIENEHLKKRQEKEQFSSLSKRDQGYFKTSNNFLASKNTNFRSAFEELRPPVSNMTLNNENIGQKTEYNNFIKHPSSNYANQLERKDSGNEIFKAGGHNRSSSGLEKDIEMLRNTKKHTDQVFEREKALNPYLNQRIFTEESRTTSGDTPFETTQKNEIQQKFLVILQKQIEEKTKELAEKNKQIWDKSNVIIEKNKNIDFLSCQVRDFKRRVDEHSDILIKKKEEYDQILTLQHQQISQLKEKLQETEESIASVKRKAESSDQKDKIIEQKNHIIEEKDRLLSQKVQEICSLQQKVKELNREFLKMESQLKEKAKENEQLRQIEQKSTIEVTKLKQSLACQENKLSILKEEIKELKKEPEKETQTEVQPKSSEQTIDKSVVKDLNSKIVLFQQQIQEISTILFNENIHEQTKIVCKIKELVQQSQKVENLMLKEQQRAEQNHVLKLHQDYFEKKCHEMNRELKRTGNKLLGVTNDAVTNCKLIFETNQEMVISNLRRLNQKYKREVDADQQQDKQ